jgi:ParB family chromosome partitioning protein
MPLVVRPTGDLYQIVAGARRYRAAKLASLEAVPARIVELTDEQMLAWQLIENSQRVDVHPYEEAEGYHRLLQMPGYDVTAIGEKTGKREAHIYSRMKLLDLIDPVAQAFQQDKIAATHALLIARLPQARQADAYEQCWRKDWQDKEAHLLPAVPSLPGLNRMCIFILRALRFLPQMRTLCRTPELALTARNAPGSIRGSFTT